MEFKSLAVGRVGDLARDAAAPRGIRHQNRIAPGKRQIGCQRRSFVAALFLDDLHEENLAAFDDLLDFILLALAMRASRHLFHRIAAELFDLGRFVLAFVAAVATGLARLRRGRARWHVALARQKSFPHGLAPPPDRCRPPQE